MNARMQVRELERGAAFGRGRGKANKTKYISSMQHCVATTLSSCT
jgi:hypothetical protein